jgi:hypothetical protein
MQTTAENTFVANLRAIAGTEGAAEVPNLGHAASAFRSNLDPATIVSRARRRKAGRRALTTSALGLVLFVGAGVAAGLPHQAPPQVIAEVAQLSVADLATDRSLPTPAIEGFAALSDSVSDDDAAAAVIAPATEAEVEPLVLDNCDAVTLTCSFEDVAAFSESDVDPANRVTLEGSANPLAITLGVTGAVALATAGHFATKARKPAANYR